MGSPIFLGRKYLFNDFREKISPKDFKEEISLSSMGFSTSP
jgi:hypothetical protein